MSMVSTNQMQGREKSNSNLQQSHATAEEIRLAQIISSNIRDEDPETQKSVAKVIEVTGTTEDNARTALYDANNDTNRAIELILENGLVEQLSEWETAGRKKNKSTTNSHRNVDAFDDEIKENKLPSSGNWERNTSKGRGRAKSTRGRGKSNDCDRKIDDGKGEFETTERHRGGRRGRGRGGSGRGGRLSGRGPRRFGRYNQNHSGQSSTDLPSEGSIHNRYGDQFNNFTNTSNRDVPQSDSAEVWTKEDEGWANLEVGTWSNEEAQKQSGQVKDSVTEPWGTGSWNDDLSKTKVFQSQNVQISTSTNNALPSHQTTVPSSGSVPQMGERIDLGALFKKNHTENISGYQQPINKSLDNQSGSTFSGSTQHTTQSVIHHLQQQGQSTSLFSDNKSVHEIDSQSSRLFGSFDRQGSTPLANNATTIGHYGSHGHDGSYSQYNGKLMPDKDKENSSTLLGSFGEQFNSSESATAGTMLNKISSLSNSAFASLKQVDSQDISSTNANYNSFSRIQQKEASEAVKASLDLPSMNTDVISSDLSAPQSGMLGIPQNCSLGHNVLSFGAPQPGRSMKQQRRRHPLSSKIPASAVEMPSAGSGTYHEMSNFDLQFGVDDNASASITSEYGGSSNATSVSAISVSQTSLFTNNVISSQTSVAQHVSSGIVENSSIFPIQLTTQSQQVSVASATSGLQTSNAFTSSSHHTAQRYLESAVPNESLRGPPGIPLPQSFSTSAPAGSSLGLSGAPSHTSDLSSSNGSYASGQAATSTNVPLSSLSHEPAMEQTQSLGNQSHSYYTSTSLGQQSQQQMVPDLSNNAGRNLRSPVPSTTLPGSLQASPMSRITGSPSNDASSSSAAAISSLTSGLTQSQILHIGGTPSKLQASSAPINIHDSSTSATSLSASGGYGSITMGYNSSSGSSQPSSVVASPGKHMSNTNLYTSSNLSSSLQHNQQQSLPVVSSANSLVSALGSSILPTASTNNTKFSNQINTSSKTGPPNLPLGMPSILPNQYGIPMGPGVMTAYTPEALYGYADSLMAVQSRVHQLPNYYDMYGAGNSQSTNSNSMNRDSTSNSSSQGKYSRGEPTSPTSVIGIIGSAGSAISQQPIATGQHDAQMKASQTGAHQAQPYMNIPAATPAYPGYSGLYYNAFQYQPMFAAATAVPGAKHQVNATTAFQQPGNAFGNAYSTASIGASTGSSIHDLQGQGYNKSHMPAYEKQQTAFHHHANTPPSAFSLQAITAAMAAANTGAAGAAGAGPGMSPYTQPPFMAMVPTHQPSQFRLHLPQHGDVNQSVGSQQSQASNVLGKTATKAPFGNTSPYWGN